MIEEILKQQQRIMDANTQLLSLVEQAVTMEPNLRIQLADIAKEISNANHEISLALIADKLP